MFAEFRKQALELGHFLTQDDEEGDSEEDLGPGDGGLGWGWTPQTKANVGEVPRQDATQTSTDVSGSKTQVPHVTISTFDAYLYKRCRSIVIYEHQGLTPSAGSPAR
jgi:hypothetical protein